MDITSIIINKLIMLPGIILALTVHEYAHAKAAYVLGDPTAKNQGRVSLNPIAHLDVVGFICLLVAGFGWGKPVPVNERYFKHKRRDDMIVSAAGVTMNLILAILLALVINIVIFASPEFFLGQLGKVILLMLQSGIYINIILMIFNLIPVPPLDGFNIVSQLTNFSQSPHFNSVYEKGQGVLLLLVASSMFFHIDILGSILDPGINGVYYLINSLMGIIF